MIDNHDSRSNNLLMSEMKKEDLKNWFDYKRNKFLHNVDTFYFSVKLLDDFTDDSKEEPVISFRKFFDKQYSLLEASAGMEYIPYVLGNDTLLIRKYSFAHMYKYCLEYPDYFDIFIAPVVPRSSSGSSSVTCELIVQIRSYMLWIYGVQKAFERSLSYVSKLCENFGLSIHFVQENRIDFCWHSNYLKNPEKFFSLENFYKMRVDRFSDALTHTEKVGTDDFEIDYVALGKRSDKVFIRIYLKSKEVVEMGYKPWFFYVWFFNGLINRYDLYCYEECYKRRSWKYLDLARLSFYAAYGEDERYIKECEALISSEAADRERVRKLADKLTPKINLIMNVEYQVMRRHTKSYELFRLRDNSSHGIAKRVYDFLDNRKPIIDYLTHYVFRLSNPEETDLNKSRRDYCGFWKALRSTRLVDCHVKNRDLKLVRDYSSKLNSQIIKTRAINSIVTMGLYSKGVNSDDVLQDVVDTLCCLNDNDIRRAQEYKEKKSRKLNHSELPGIQEPSFSGKFSLIDEETGELWLNSSSYMEEISSENI